MNGVRYHLLGNPVNKFQLVKKLFTKKQQQQAGHGRRLIKWCYNKILESRKKAEV